MRFRFDESNGFRKVVDFKDRLSDTGFYLLGSVPVFFGASIGGGSFPVGTTLPLVLTRNGATSTFTAYVNGAQAFSFVDGSSLSVFSAPANVIWFFRDDVIQNAEAAPGTVDELRIWDGALSASEVADAFASVTQPVATVPLPSSVLLLCTGLAGLLLQRRRARS